MKKFYLALIAVVVLAVPFSAQAQTSCFKLTCDYVTDGGFVYSGLYWTESGTTYPTIADPCLWGAPSNIWARIGNGGYIEQTFYVNSDYTSYSFQHLARLVNDTNNFYDQLKITVTNQTSGQSEVFYLRGSTYDNSCNIHGWTLVNNYDYSTVKVRLEVAALSLSAWEVDNLAFFGRHF